MEKKTMETFVSEAQAITPASKNFSPSKLPHKLSQKLCTMERKMDWLSVIQVFNRELTISLETLVIL